MNILLIGSGGREHALAWKLAQSPTLGKLYAAPGNPGIAEHAECATIDVVDHAAVVGFCRTHAIDLIVIGPEGPLVAGLADDLRAAGFATFGPGRDAAQLEGSKAFTKALCTAHDIPTAAWSRHETAASATAAADRFGFPVVIKADGLAAGKGVVIASNRAEADAAIATMFDGSFGAAGHVVVIEEFLTGEEVSLFALSDGATVIPFASAQDHKRVGDGDTGPNTGGMGAYSPAPVLTPALQDRAMRDIVQPTVDALAAAGTPFVGVLFAGLMLTSNGPSLIEFNARFGDPETQAILPRYRGDLAMLLHAVATGTLAQQGQLEFSDDVALTVVMAANGYPGTPERGGRIGNLRAASAAGAIVFHAGTALDGNRLVASGGRVLGVTAVAPDMRSARNLAYDAVGTIDFSSGFWRDDIGWREINRI